MIKLLQVSLIIKQLQYCIFNARLQTMTRRGRKTGLKHICKAFFEARASKSKKKLPHSIDEKTLSNIIILLKLTYQN